MPKKKFFSDMPAESQSASVDDFASVFAKQHPDVAQRPVYSEILPLDVIEPSPFQARRTFEAIEELRDAIITLGFQSRLRVRPKPDVPGRFQLVYGERRLRAARAANLPEVPVDIGEYSDAEMIEIGLSENIQRQDLRPLEEAEMFGQLIESGQYTTRSLAERVGKNKDYVDTRLALLRAPEDVQQLVAQMPDAVTAARRIASLPDEADRQPLIAGLLSGTMRAETVRVAVNTLRDTPPSPTTPVRINGQKQDNLPPKVENKHHALDPEIAKIVSEEARIKTILTRWRKTLEGSHDEASERIIRALSDISHDMERMR